MELTKLNFEYYCEQLIQDIKEVKLYLIVKLTLKGGFYQSGPRNDWNQSQK